MVKISSSTPLKSTDNFSEKHEQSSKYKILNPQALKPSLYHCFNNICDSGGPDCDCDCDRECDSTHCECDCDRGF
ncbi:MAG: hypothetical protein KR126chlam6_00561 [Candidatus Anoxychlamydiales bacterium]|nr:hypothetical protein [Candidatus Anoxychlamydiales bacterium]